MPYELQQKLIEANNLLLESQRYIGRMVHLINNVRARVSMASELLETNQDNEMLLEVLNKAMEELRQIIK